MNQDTVDWESSQAFPRQSAHGKTRRPVGMMDRSQNLFFEYLRRGQSYKCMGMSKKFEFLKVDNSSTTGTSGFYVVRYRSNREPGRGFTKDGQVGGWLRLDGRQVPAGAKFGRLSVLRSELRLTTVLLHSYHSVLIIVPIAF